MASESKVLDLEGKKRTRTMTPELLEKLAKARERASQIMKERKEAHKKVQSGELSAPAPVEAQKGENPLQPPMHEEPQVQLPEPPAPKQKKQKPTKAERTIAKLQRVVEQESSDSSNDDSDPEDVVSDFLKKKYRHKYKTKYESKVNQALLKGQAAHHIRNRVSEDLVRLASQSIFGTY